MPRISEFYGITIYMYWRDHNPPHFHAMYGSDEALVSIADGSLIAGSLPPRALRLVEEWRALHQSQLGTVSWPNGVDLDPDVLHGGEVPATGHGPRVLSEVRLRSAG